MNNDIFTKRRNYWRVDVFSGHRTIGRLVSTPAGFMLQTQDPTLRWFRRRYYRTASHLVEAVRQCRGDI